MAACISACMSPPPTQEPVATDQTVVIKYRISITDPAAPELLTELGRLAHTSPPHFLRPMSGQAFVYRFQLKPEQKIGDLLFQLRRSDKIEFVETDVQVRSQ